MGLDNEYDSLRQEILNWQEKRFTMVSGSIILITAVLGLAIKNNTSIPGELLSTILLAFLICVSLLTWYFGTSNARMSAYIEVFYEKENTQYRWHSRNRKFKQKSLFYKILSLNSCLALIYLVLGIISIVIPTRFTFNLNSIPGYLLPLLSLIFILVLIIMAFFSYPRNKYIQYWEEIKKLEKPTSTMDNKIKN